MLFLLLLFGLDPQAASNEQKIVQETPRWVLTRDELREGEVVEGWIVLPPPENGSAGLGAEQRPGQPLTSVVLEAPSNVAVWFARDQNCTTTQSDQRRWTGSTPDNGLLKVCARPTDDRAFLLIAVIGQPGGTIQVISSDKVSIQPGSKLDPAVIGFLTTAGGFLLGMVVYAGQKMVDRWLSARDSRKAMVKTVTEMLVKEISENREKLSRYIEGKELEPPTLEMGQYVALLGDEGAMSFLNSEERKEYFPRIENLYAEIGDYNDAVNNLLVMPETAEAVLKAGKALRQRLNNVARKT
jgi:hypothetical protein